MRKHINDLYEDLRDGHNLISLLEVLSGVKLVSPQGWAAMLLCPPLNPLPSSPCSPPVPDVSCRFLCHSFVFKCLLLSFFYYYFFYDYHFFYFFYYYYILFVFTQTHVPQAGLLVTTKTWD